MFNFLKLKRIDSNSLGVRATKSDLAKALNLLSNKEKKKLLLVILIQVFFGLIDLLAVAIVGILGALAVRGVQSRPPGDKVSQVLKFLHIANFNLQMQVTILGLLAVFLLLTKTAFSVIFIRRTLLFLSRRSASISAELLKKVLSSSLLKILERSTQDYLYAITSGVNQIMVGVIGVIVSLVSDLTLMIILLAGLFIVDKWIAISTLVIFSLLGLVLYGLLAVKVRNLSIYVTQNGIKSSEQLAEVLSSYRELFVRNRRGFYVDEIKRKRLDMAESSASLAFMPNISKYVLELAVIISSLLICAIEFKIYDASRAVAILSVFMAASTRIAPAVLRIQQSAISIRGNLAAALPTLNLIDSFFNSNKNLSLRYEEENYTTNYLGFTPSISISNISFSYPKNGVKVIDNLFLTINPGEVVAIVGPSGAGKTTLVDICLGVIEPDFGEVKISGKTPIEAIQTWAGAIAYVPQDVLILNASIKQNIALGFPDEKIEIVKIQKAIELAHLSDFVDGNSKGIDSQVGERGKQISGGQRQRLGIARALYTEPKLLVLDEATSSLDGFAEAAIADSILHMRGNVTVVMIAHRLSTVRTADKVVYMEKGRILSIGTFEEVRATIPNFDIQAKLMGL